MFKLAMAQMRVEGGAKTANLARALERIETAAHNGAHVVLLPEALDLGWTFPPEGLAGAVPAGEASALLAAAARRYRVYVCAGLVEQAPDQVFNTAVLLDPEGRLLLHHRKLNELEIGHACYGQGDRLAVAHTPLGCFGLMICADAFARGQVISRTLALMGADILLSPSAWAVPADHDNRLNPYGKLWLDNYGPVAREHQLWIAGVSNVGRIDAGPWKGRQCIGCSLLVGPDGRAVLQGPYGPEADTLLYADIAPVPRPARGDGWERFWANQPPRR